MRMKKMKVQRWVSRLICMGINQGSSDVQMKVQLNTAILNFARHRSTAMEKEEQVGSLRKHVIARRVVTEVATQQGWLVLMKCQERSQERQGKSQAVLAVLGLSRMLGLGGRR